MTDGDARAESPRHEVDLETLVELAITPLGLAGIYVGEDVDAVVERIGEPITRGPSSQAPDEKMEFLEYGPFAVVGYDGRVDALWALEGYRGETVGGIGVGMPWTELLRRCPDIAFDDYRLAWCVPGWPYMAIEVSRPSRDESEAALSGPWTEDWDEITDPDNAFVSLISIALDDRRESLTPAFDHPSPTRGEGTGGGGESTSE
ncbi:MAG: hypothetical protein EPO22_01980 [Dehalococcoidia bacterium]|nr:MAG: hypothetical protein EPO22_01980 [Dehalococcoidia bacterium]